MTVAELKKELEKYNDNDVIVLKSSRYDRDGRKTTDYFEVMNLFNKSSNYKIISEKRAKKLLDE